MSRPEHPTPPPARPRQPAPPVPPLGEHVAGVDEAGCGPWAGPVVASAVILRRRLRGVRIDDSKRLTPLARQRACDAILEHAAVGIGIVCAADVDRWNIHRAALRAMQQAIEDLPRLPQLILVDGTTAPAATVPCRAIIDGDASCYIISCASIVAKVLRDRLMTFYHQLLPDYAFDRHKGYGTELHARRLERFGPSVLHRMTFRPVAAALAAGPVSVAAVDGA